MTDFHEYLEILIRDGIREAESFLAADRADFTFPTAKAQWAPPRHYNIQKLILDWKMDLKNEHVDATSKLVEPRVSRIDFVGEVMLPPATQAPRKARQT